MPSIGSRTLLRQKHVITPSLSPKAKKFKTRKVSDLAHQYFLNQPQIIKLTESLPPKEKADIAILTDLRKDPFTRSTTLRRLIETGDKRLVPFFERALSDKNANIREAALEAINRLRLRRSIPAVEKRLNDSFSSNRAEAIAILGQLSNKRSVPLFKQKLGDESMADEIFEFLETHDKKFRLGELYKDNIGNPLFTQANRALFRKFQEKTGSKTILLGGKLYKKAVIKLVNPENLEAWKKAQETGIPVEPILTKDKKYRTNPIMKGPDNGKIRVIAGVINGSTVGIFLKRPENKIHAREVERQMLAIVRQLDNANIHHSHLNKWNFIVKMIKSGNKRIPKVYLIDFDHATIQEGTVKNNLFYPINRS